MFILLQGLPAAAITPCQEPPVRLSAPQSLWCSSLICNKKVLLALRLLLESAVWCFCLVSTCLCVFCSPRGHLGARRVCALPVERPSNCGSSHGSVGLVKEGFHPQDLHLFGSTRLPSGHAWGLQRYVKPCAAYTGVWVWLVPHSGLIAFSLVFRRYSFPSRRPCAFAPANSRESCGTKLPAGSACRRCGGLCSFESTGTARDTDRWG